MNEHGCIPIKLSLEKLAVGQIGQVGGNLLALLGLGAGYGVGSRRALVKALSKRFCFFGSVSFLSSKFLYTMVSFWGDTVTV